MQISLAAARVNAGYSQAAVARFLRKSKATIVAWEKGNTQIDKGNFDALCRLYQMDGDYIILPSKSAKSVQSQAE